jgi:hypothetical protein
MRRFLGAAFLSLTLANAASIDRRALVSRHAPVNASEEIATSGLPVDSPLTVGNGGFAFTCDVTGLQTFDGIYQREGIPLETLSRWCWHSEPNPADHRLEDASKPYTQGDGRRVSYPTDASTPAGQWLRRNPHHMPLGRIRLVYFKSDNTGLQPEDIMAQEQTLDLWAGTIRSRFEILGKPVEVTTLCHPRLDQIAVRIVSPEIAAGRLMAEISFPRGHELEVKNNPPLDWTRPESHRTELVALTKSRAELRRTIDGTRYQVGLEWSGRGEIAEYAPHHFLVYPTGASESFEFVASFRAGGRPETLPDFEETRAASAKHWRGYWSRGAAVDFTGSTDPRAAELERRVVLSQYLTAVQMAGDTPPQESGLTGGTWYGKHHSEMIWWHAAHFALWGRDDLLEKNLAWYRKQLPEARRLAKSRGLRGARWAKMTGPDGRESPGGNPLIIWNQPHMIYLCELLYRNSPGPGVLVKYRDLVMETADCMASMAWLDDATGNYNLGPPLWIAQELHDPATSRNPSFELAYWKWSLGVARQWRERLGMKPVAAWDRVIDRLAPIPQKDGLYVALESHPDTFDNIASRHDHPSMLAPLGFLPGTGVDRKTMDRTLDAVLAHWDWETKIWGWDYPMIAMTATRLGRPEDAVEILLRDGPNNLYLPNGHCPQRVDESIDRRRKREIPTYLPANGALLSAVALMTAGWDGCGRKFPGFPADGGWTIRAEGLKPFP